MKPTTPIEDPADPAERTQRLFCPNCLALVEVGQPTCRGCAFGRPEVGWPCDAYLGRTFAGKYEVVERLGRGGFGVVVRARHRQGGHDLGDVVLKFMRPDLAENAVDRQRFINEARAARSLSSPHVVKVFDLDFDEQGIPFMVMECLEGRSLADVVRDGPLPVARALRLGVQISGAMAECHASGVIHRDLKPANLLLLPVPEGDFIKIIDFGNARLGEGSGTRTLIGTPRYMAPEQILRGDLDGRVDVFGLGVILYECLSGKPPIVADNELEYLELNVGSAPRPLRDLLPAAPEVLEGLLGRMMAKDADARPASMSEVQQRLQAINSAAGPASGPVARPTRPLEAAAPIAGEGQASASLAGRSRVGVWVSVLTLVGVLLGVLLGGFALWWVQRGERSTEQAGRVDASSSARTRSTVKADAGVRITAKAKASPKAKARPKAKASPNAKASPRTRRPVRERAPAPAKKKERPKREEGWGPEPVDDL
ncbi:MAG: serine/threonine protein kinase [Deltaproteobacteria bacterium]|nr:serine/threonine protein kinase [Deltaproteobacteria bacterium]